MAMTAVERGYPSISVQPVGKGRPARPIALIRLRMSSAPPVPSAVAGD